MGRARSLTIAALYCLCLQACLQFIGDEYDVQIEPCQNMFEYLFAYTIRWSYSSGAAHYTSLEGIVKNLYIKEPRYISLIQPMVNLQTLRGAYILIYGVKTSSKKVLNLEFMVLLLWWDPMPVPLLLPRTHISHKIGPAWEIATWGSLKQRRKMRFRSCPVRRPVDGKKNMCFK